MTKRALLSLCLLSVMVAGLTVTGAAPASAGLSPTRTCKNFDTGDEIRRLSICARIWFNDTINQSRGVLEMHTYILVNGHWTDVTSQSITVNFASFNGYDNLGILQFAFGFGNSLPSGGTTCRVNGPSGNIACSVPNTGRVAFYSRAFNGTAPNYIVNVSEVSWRDDRGQPHTVDTEHISSPDRLPLFFCIPSSIC
jgi:hypothetical protein